MEQFGVGFNEVTIADSSDYLDDPRDLEFHPGRANELWIANRATDTITIVENTGLENQTSQNRADSHRNHFLEEVSAISFGAYHPNLTTNGVQHKNRGIPTTAKQIQIISWVRRCGRRP